MKFAFISRHLPTPEQIELAKVASVELVQVGDRDGFRLDPREFYTKFEGVVVVHPAAALKCIPFMNVGVFRNGTRPVEGDRPAFYAAGFTIYGPSVGEDNHTEEFTQ